MEGPRAANLNELQSVIDLINLVFRAHRNYPPTMGEEFPLLLCEDNLDNMRVFVDEGMPVSDINYYKTDVYIQGSVIKAASIGAVCTHPDYRGRNLASRLLDDIEDRLKKDGTDLMLVSGDRGLYLRRGCTVVGGFVYSELNNFGKNYFGLELMEYDKEYLPVMARIYNEESTRFHRSFYEFENILRGSTVSWGRFTYKVYLIKNKGNITGYIILQISNGTTRTGELVEFAGDRKDVCDALISAAKMLDLSSIDIYSSIYDPINLYLKEMGADMKDSRQLGTVKIINFTSFMDRLRPYFAQYLPRDIYNTLEFAEIEGTFIIRVSGEELKVQGQGDCNHIIFGNPEGGKMEDSLIETVNGKPHVKQFIDSVFPLPFPWAANLNYI